MAPPAHEQTLFSMWAALGTCSPARSSYAVDPLLLRLELVGRFVRCGLVEEVLALIAALPQAKRERSRLYQRLIEELLAIGLSALAERLLETSLIEDRLLCFQTRLGFLERRSSPSNLLALRKLGVELAAENASTSAQGAVCLTELYRVTRDPLDLDQARSYARACTDPLARFHGYGHLGCTTGNPHDFANAFSALKSWSINHPLEAEARARGLMHRLCDAVRVHHKENDPPWIFSLTDCERIVVELGYIEECWADELFGQFLTAQVFRV